MVSLLQNVKKLPSLLLGLYGWTDADSGCRTGSPQKKILVMINTQATAKKKMAGKWTANSGGDPGGVTARLLCASNPVDSRSPITVRHQLS